ARDAGAKTIFGFGWDRNFPPDFPYRQQLDAICDDIPIYFADEEAHKGMANTLALVNAGIMSKDGTTLKKEMRGGVIAIGADGTPTGYLSEQAGTFVRSFLDNEYLFSVDVVKGFMPKIEQQLHSEGYTMYLDGWGNYFYNTNFHKAAQEMDKAGDLHFVLGLTYEIEGWMNPDEELPKAVEAQKYASTRVKTNWIKLFIDGTVETGTGFIEPVYKDGHQGSSNWSEEAMTDITRKANENGLTMHIHAMGNAGVNRVVNSYINGGKPEMRNTIVHLRNVNEPDYKRMADNNIYVTSGMLWHHASKEQAEEWKKGLPGKMAYQGYPMKSFFDNGIPVSLHTDYPALSNSPDDPFGVMEIALTGVCYFEGGDPLWTEELVTREQALTALTIGCAQQMFLENERGSIKPGKYADFLLVNKDVLSCPVKEIHTAKPKATYFEGKKVFSM
ncbi:MAG: amidohydrolase family protein, partial [Selenomonadaceae bacterium]|nr:amidohydrolase family protein [Selenomonadaceae bacterium]